MENIKLNYTENSKSGITVRESKIIEIEKVLHTAGFGTEKQNDGLMWKTDKDNSIFIPVDEDGRIQDLKYSGPNEDVDVIVNSSYNSFEERIEYNNKVLETANVKSHIGKSAYLDFIRISGATGVEESIIICFYRNGVIFFMTNTLLQECEIYRRKCDGDIEDDYYEEADFGYWEEEELLREEREKEEFSKY